MMSLLLLVPHFRVRRPALPIRGSRTKQLALSALVAVSILLPPLLANAEQARKVYRIGALWPYGAETLRQALADGLRELGYVEGKNIVMEYRSADGMLDRLSVLAADLVRLNVDVIVANGNQAIDAARRATRAVPIVMANSDDPVGMGFIANLARPGGNLTGLTTMGPELGGKRLQLLKEAVPRASRVAVLWNPATPAQESEWRELQRAARALNMTLYSLEVKNPVDFDDAFSEMAKLRPDVLVTVVDPLTFFAYGWIAQVAAKNRLPAISGMKQWAEQGGLIAYGPNIPDLFHRVATHVDKILKGAKPADLPVEQPTRFELVINLKTAKALGLMIPQSFLVRADHLIE